MGRSFVGSLVRLIPEYGQPVRVTIRSRMRQYICRKLELRREFRYDSRVMTQRPPHLKKVKTSLYLEPARLAKLRALSEKTMIPTSALVRRGIDLVIEEYKKK